MPEAVTANQGTADQLPQGAATALNESMPSQLAPEGLAPPAEGEAPDPYGIDHAMPEPEQAGAADFNPAYTPESDDEAWLTGPSLNPDEAVTAGVGMDAPEGTPELRLSLPVLVSAAQLPGAPPQLTFLAQYLADRLL